MQLIKRSHIIFSIIAVFVVCSSIFYFNTQIEPTSQNHAQNLQSSALSPDVYIQYADRKIIVSRFDTISATDTLTFVNNGSTPIDYVYYTLNDTYLPYFYTFYARSSGESTLAYQESQNTLFGYKTFIVYLNTPIFPESNQTVLITTVYSGLFRAHFDSQTSNQYVYFNFSIVPFSPYYIYDSDVIITFPYRTFFDSYTGDPSEDGTSLIYTVDEVLPFSEEIVYVEGYNNQYSTIQFTEITRRIYINPWGFIRVVEEHQLLNTGDLYINRFDFNLPKLAYNITMYDGIGTIQGASFDEEDGQYSVILTNRAGINPNATKNYFLEYYLPIGSYFSRSYRTASLKMDLNLMNHGVLIKNQHTYLHLYAGKSIEFTSLTPDSISYEDNSMILYYHHTDVLSLTDYYLFLEYKESGFQLIARGLLFTAILIVAFAMYAVIRTRTKSRSDDEEVVREEIIPEAEMREFILNYEEITAIRIDIQQLESDLSRKKIAKKNYTKQLKLLESKLKVTQDDIKPFKKSIMNAGGPISEIVKRLDLHEAELISNQDSIQLYDERYKKGKLPSKQAYQTLRNQMIDNAEKIQRQIDRYINQMKAYLI